MLWPPLTLSPIPKPGFIPSYPVWHPKMPVAPSFIWSELYLVLIGECHPVSHIYFRFCVNISNQISFTIDSTSFFYQLLSNATSLNTNATTTSSTRWRSEESTCFANWSYASLCTDANSVGVTQPLSHSAWQRDLGRTGFCNNKMTPFPY